MRPEHSAMPAEDLTSERIVRFHLRGETDLIPVEISWEALDRLEKQPAAQRAERLARFETHRTLIEAAAIRKAKKSSGPVHLGIEDVLRES